MCCGHRRYVVVSLGFLGLLICIGSREVFTMIVTHVISHNLTGAEEELPVCCNSSAKDFHQQTWKVKYVFFFQTAYFIATIVTQLPGGLLAAKFSPRRVCGVSILISSLLNIAIPFALQYNKATVFAVRILQGLAEGPSVPSLNGVISCWAPKTEKTILITIAYSGAYLSAAVASIVSGLLIKCVSWHAALFLYGGVGTIWAVLWLCCIHDGPSVCPGLSDKEKEVFGLNNNNADRKIHKTHVKIPWRGILTSRPVSAILVAAFCRNWIFAILITQIPQYFKDAFNMSSAKRGLWSSLPHIFMTMVVISGGLMVDNMIKKNWLSTTVARKLAETIGFGVEAGCFLALGIAHITDETTAIIILSVGVAFSGIAISGYQPNPLDLAPKYVSVVTGIVRLGAIGSVLSTVVAAQLTGDDTKRGHHLWKDVFIVGGSIHLGGVIYYLIFASGERQPWAEEEYEAILPDVIADKRPHTIQDDGFFSDNGESEAESLLTRSLRVDRMTDYDDDDDDLQTPSWFLNTI